MNTKKFSILLLLGLQFGLAASAQKEQLSLRVPNFVRPLVEKLVAEYSKTNNVDFQFVSAKAQDTESTLSFTTNEDAVSFARYAVLPVTARDSEAARLLGGSQLSAKKLRNLFFVKDELDDERKESKAEKTLHIYTGASQQTVSRVYAANFSQEASNYKGKKIVGDDSFLNTAISRDPLGVTINSLPNIFDLESRHVRGDLSLVALDVDKQSRQVLSEGSLDDIITLLEKHDFNEIPVGSVGLAYNHSNAQLNKFARWILTDGVKYVHEYGLLQLSQKELSAQIGRTAEQGDLALCL